MLKGMENKREQEEGQGFDAESFVFFLSIRKRQARFMETTHRGRTMLRRNVATIGISTGCGSF